VSTYILQNMYLFCLCIIIILWSYLEIHFTVFLNSWKVFYNMNIPWFYPTFLSVVNT
jgi:hypothetical protein